MKQQELRELQIEFEKLKPSIKSEYKGIESLRKIFVNDYPTNRILQLTKDEYVIGKGNLTFCNRLENELNGWGNIHGSPALKFGLYFGKLGDDKTRKFRIGKKAFGSNENSALRNILNSIVNLIENPNDLHILRENLISPMFKGKILSVYHPDKFLNIFSASHLNYFINALGLDNSSKNELDKQNLLLEYKNSDNVMKEWNNYYFGKFLYVSFKNPNDEINEKNLAKPLRDFISKDFPPIEDVKIQFVSLETESQDEELETTKKRSGKIVHSAKSKRNKKIGDRGEQIIFKAEKDYLIRNGKSQLAKLLDKVSDIDDTLGYDLVSYDLDGTKKYIEIKSTCRKIGNSNIFITANEFETSLSLKNYYFYIVYEVDTKEPKIWRVKAVDFLENKNIVKKPVLFKIDFKTK